MATYYIVRHGQTLANKEGILQGHLDVPLSEHGKKQAELVAKALSTADIDAVYSSDLDRARATAEIIGRYHNLDPILDPRLREIHCGSLQGRTMEDSRKLFPEFFMAFREDPINAVRPGGGESFADLYHRSVSFFQEVLHKHPDSNVVIVTHGGVIRCLLAYANAVEPDPSSPTPANASISIISKENGNLRVKRVSDTTHLADLGENVQGSNSADTYRWLD